MIELNVANNAYSKLQSAISASDTSITVEDASSFPDAPFLVFLYDSTNYEIMKVTAKNGNTFSVQRAQEGTTARAWEQGTPVELRWTAGMYNEIKNAINYLIETLEEIING